MNLPSWMVPGTQFRDPDGDKCIYLGQAPWRSTERVPVQLGETVIGHAHQIKFRGSEYVYAYLYKGEWHMSSFEKSYTSKWDEAFAQCKRGWEDYPQGDFMHLPPTEELFLKQLEGSIGEFIRRKMHQNMSLAEWMRYTLQGSELGAAIFFGRLVELWRDATSKDK